MFLKVKHELAVMLSLPESRTENSLAGIVFASWGYDERCNCKHCHAVATASFRANGINQDGSLASVGGGFVAGLRRTIPINTGLLGRRGIPLSLAFHCGQLVAAVVWWVVRQGR